MNDKILYIEQNAIESSLLTELQQKTLHELQRLSGGVWTNFNAHDPGVTTSDAANNVLSELNYKLGFDLIDYLVLKQVNFEPEGYGMYIPEKVYPTTPVTLKDYRKLLLSYFPTLEDVIIELSPERRFVIKAIPSSLIVGNRQDVTAEIKDLFNSNRNLCEALESVTLSEREKLYLHSEITVRSKEDVTTVLAQVYWKILSYLSGGFRFEKYENLLDGEFYWEELFEGPVVKKQLIIPQQENTMAELYGILCQIDGVKGFKTCYLAKSLGDLKNIISDFKKGYSLFIPTNKDELKVKIRIDEVEVEITKSDFDDFIKKLKTLYLLNRSSYGSNDSDTELSRKFLPTGLYRHVYDYRTIAKDFPACYRVSLPLSDEKCNKQFYGYLKLFDLILQRGLKELSEIKNLLSIKTDGAVLSNIDLITSSMGISVSEKDRYRKVFVLKNQYLDFLDHLYGVESNPELMEWLKAGTETEDDFLKRRMSFLRNVPWLLQTRSKAYNIYKPRSKENVPTIKAYLSFLLGMNMDEDILAGNVLSRYNLELVEDRKGEQKVLQKGVQLKLVEVYEEVVNSSNWKIDESAIIVRTGEDREADYRNVLKSLSIFNSGKIDSELFRNGIDIANYRIIHSGNEFELIFVNRKKQTLDPLARSIDKNELKNWAIMLTHFLYDMNSQSEVVYVLENHLFSTREMSVSFVFSASSARFSSIVFQKNIMKFIRSLLPAHLILRVYWLTQANMSLFEAAYKEWTDALMKNETNKFESIEKKIKEILNPVS